MCGRLGVEPCRARRPFAIGWRSSPIGEGRCLRRFPTRTGREPQFENSSVKVWKSLVLPNNPLPLHRHEHPRVIIALRGGSMKILEDTGKSQVHEWQTGKAYWLDANAPGTQHQDINVGDGPIEVMVVELQNEK
jgi:beta-alanine degradation protein BauB